MAFSISKRKKTTDWFRKTKKQNEKGVELGKVHLSLIEVPYNTWEPNEVRVSANRHVESTSTRSPESKKVESKHDNDEEYASISKQQKGELMELWLKHGIKGKTVNDKGDVPPKQCIKA